MLCFKYTQSHLFKPIWIGKDARNLKDWVQKSGCSCSHVHSLWLKIPSDYIRQPALYVHVIMSFCIRSNKGLLHVIMKVCIIIYCSPLNESPCCRSYKWAVYQELFKPPPLMPEIHTDNFKKDCIELWVIQNWYQTLLLLPEIYVTHK